MSEVPATFPDFSAESFNPASTSAVLETQGVLLLRQAVSTELISAWLPIFEASFIQFDALQASGKMDRLTYENLYRYGHVHPLAVPGIQEWFNLVLSSPVLRDVLRAHFGEQAHLILNNCAPRRQGPVHPDHSIPFHQDQEFMGRMQRAVNVWVPMTPAGGEYPGLELWVGGPQTPMLSFALSPTERKRVSDKIPPEALWKPMMSPGDVMIFTPYTIHRTWYESSMPKTRFSSEIRLSSTPDSRNTRSALIVRDL